MLHRHPCAPALLLLVGLALPACLPALAQADPEYRADIEAWRQEREKRLRSEDGWLSLVGLYWLQEGENSFGADPTNDLVFPPGKIAARAGVFLLTNGAVTLQTEPGSDITHQGRAVGSLTLMPDTTGKPTILERGSLLFYVIQRGDRLGIRLKDRASPALATFEGIETFPVDPKWRLEARFEPYEPPRTIRVPNILGTTSEETCHGALIFELDGVTYRLDPLGKPDGELFVIFGDATNGQQTYGGGRFLYAEPPGPGGKTILDFNKAYNPPCVFTSYATCPLPPRQNRLPVPVEAGEKMYGDGHHAG